ncbi:MAG: tetratricopeptide repeat protein [Planctomycetes bacterium]|nr:tetratricopeptide repeat protein [Planctomycetota bacterium]
MGRSEASGLPPWPRAKGWWTAPVLALAVLAAFGPVVRNGWIDYDDGSYVQENPPVQRGFDAESLAWAFTTGHSANWHPLTWLSHMADCALWGLEPAGHHLTSLLLHALNAALLYLALRRLTGQAAPSALAAGLFALHPLRVESVAWVAERKDVLSGCFALLALWSYARHREGPTPARYLAVAGFLALGLMSKPMLVTLPFVLLLLDWWPLRRSPAGRTRAVLEKLPLLALVAASSAVTFKVQEAGGAVSPLERMSLEVRSLNALDAYARYLGKTVWPSDLAVFYPHAGASLEAWRPAASAVLLAALTAGAWGLRRRHPYLLVGWLWFLGTLVPVIGLVQVGAQSMADRYTYLPSMGLAVAASWLAFSWAPRRRLGQLAAVAAGLLIALGVLTARQALLWRDTETLFRHALAAEEGNWLAHNKLGYLRYQEGHVAEAIVHYRTSLGINPDHADAHNNLGIALAETGGLEEAVREFEAALRSRPGYRVVLVNLGNALVQLQRPRDAEARLREAIALDPRDAAALYNLGNALSAQEGRSDEALAAYEEALRVKPDYARPHVGLANLVMARQGVTEEVLGHYTRALELDPGDAETISNYGSVLVLRKDYDRAVEQFRRALDLKPRFADAHNNWGVALLEMGDARAAADHFQAALEINPAHPKARQNLEKARPPSRGP